MTLPPSAHPRYIKTGAKNGRPAYRPKKKPKNQIQFELVERRTRSRNETVGDGSILAPPSPVKFLENSEFDKSDSSTRIIFD
jgi:hypothetical protein